MVLERILVLEPPCINCFKALATYTKVYDRRRCAQLSSQEIDDIVAFLGSLTGEQPKLTYPILPPSIAATPRPQP